MSDPASKTTRAACVERAVRDVFEKNFIGQAMPYERARSLVWLERAIIDNVIGELTRLEGDRG